MRAVEGFIMFYVHPREICSEAGPQALARFDAILTPIRKEHLQVFELLEETKEYLATMTALHWSEEQLRKSEYRRRNVDDECARHISLMPRMYEHHKKNKLFEYYLDLFSKPI